MLFIMIVLGVVVGMALYSMAALYVITRPKVMKRYFEWINKITYDIAKDLEEEMFS